MSNPTLTLRQRLKLWLARRKNARRHVRSLRVRIARRKSLPTVMFDSVTLDQIPADAKAVAGYVGGRWPTFPKLAEKWPNARRLSIAVASRHDADCLDIEPGDAQPSDAAAWVLRQKQRGIKKPVVYTSASQLTTVLKALAAHGIKRADVKVWTAHYTLRPHLCGPGCGFGITTTADATQWTDKSRGRNLDESLCTRSFWA